MTDEYALLRGLRLHYRDWAGPSPEAPALVVLHGFTGHARSWDRLATVMSARYRVLALDARGHGESAWAASTADYATAEQVADVIALADALRIERFALLGLSMGGRTAMNLAATHPQRVERLVVVDIGPQVAAAGAARISSGVAVSDTFASPEEAFAAARAANATPPEDELWHRTRNNLLLQADGTWTWRYDVALRRGGSQLPRPDVAGQWAMLASITAPTLLVRGELSDVLDVADADRMVATIPTCAMVTVPGAGHSVPLDQPVGFVDAVTPFLLG